MKSPTAWLHTVEDELIRCCATTKVTKERREVIRRLARGCADWNYLVESCRVQRVTALVAFTMDANAADLVPEDVLAVLRARLSANARRNLFLTQSLLSLIEEFRRHKIEVIPFKGPFLALTTYQNIALREFLDLDIIVQKTDFSRARDLLTALGYRPGGLQAAQRTEAFFESQLGCDYVRADGRVILELHWSFVQTWLGFHVDMETIWNAPQSFRAGREKILAIPDDIMLLYLCAHGAKHYWNRLSWVVDVAEFVQSRENLNWEALLAKATRTGCRRTLLIGLQIATLLLGTSLPPMIQAEIRADSVALSMAEKLGKEIFRSNRDACSRPEGWAQDWFHIRTKERWREKLIYVGFMIRWTLSPSPKDRQWVQLPHWLNWLYLLLRPVRVAWQSLPVRGAS